jgi:hypothetical protein
MRSFVTWDIVFRKHQQNITQMNNTVTFSTYGTDVNFTKIHVDKPEGKKPFGRQRCM